jgi:DNA polymerase III subunit alpha, Gram-positive type
MQRELIKFFELIKFEPSLYYSFENANLLIAEYDKKNKVFVIKIEIIKLLEPSIYLALKQALLGFPYGVDLKIMVKDQSSITEDQVNLYFAFFIDNYLKGSSAYQLLRKLKVLLVNNQIIVRLNSRLLQESLTSFENLLRDSFKIVGFEQPLVFELVTLDNEEVAKLIEQEKNKALEQGSQELAKPEDKINKRNNGFYRKSLEEAIEVEIQDLKNEDVNVIVKGQVFLVDVFDYRSGGRPIYTIYITNQKRSIGVKLRENQRFTLNFITSIKEGMVLKVTGDMKPDFYGEYNLEPKVIEILTTPTPRQDIANEKRVELHLHTKMSSMDGITDAEEYIKRALAYGHKAIAITDHGVVQAFPDAQNAAKGKDIKVIYGMEAYVVDDKIHPVRNSKDLNLKSSSYVLFDIETTGLSARHDEIIEIGAVKVQNGVIIDQFQSFVNPRRKITNFSKQLTGIDDAMVLGAPTFEQIIPEFINFIKDSVLVAHNAGFDYDFINTKLRANKFSEINQPLIDTLTLAKCIYPNQKTFSLGSLAKGVGIAYDEEAAHRADYDAKILTDIFNIMLAKLDELKVINLNQINTLSPDNAWNKNRNYHVTLLAQNEIGLKNLYEIVSLSHLKYISEVPLVPRSELEKHRAGILLGSACFNGEIFEVAQTKSELELLKAMDFYDFIEVQPLENYSYLVDIGKVESPDRIIQYLKDIIYGADKINKMVVATGDAHYLDPEEKMFRDVFIYAKAKNAMRHPLYDYKRRVKESPRQHFRTTAEMMEGFLYLDQSKAYEIVVLNSNKVADMIEPLKPIKGKLLTPKLDGVDAQLEIEKLVATSASDKYGLPLPPLIEQRILKELNAIRKNNFGVIYYLAHLLVKKSRDDGYLVGSRGSVGSSLVATLAGITEVNPLPPHYLCKNCKHHQFFEDGSVKSGYDLKDIACPKCGQLMSGEGQDIPFETFLGFEGEKVPDIDLNFSSEYQPLAHEYTKQLLGEKNVFRAGTISTVAEKTTFGFARNYYEEIGETNIREADLKRVVRYCEGVKRTTGQHPGGLIVVPSDKDIHDFTPVQYPADSIDANWKTTHFKFEALHDDILKLDLLGHDDPSMLRMLHLLTDINPEDIPMNDPKVLSLFTTPSSLNVKPTEILSGTGTSGVPEFGTATAKEILGDAKPTKFSELIQVSGLSHGTNVWRGNAQVLIKEKVATLMDVIGCRDDIMIYLMQHGLKDKEAFEIMEKVRKGKGLNSDNEKLMLSHDVPSWYVDSCKKIKYMFPKAHAVAYIMMALRVAWYKVYYPLAYYAAFFTIRSATFEIETMTKSYQDIKKRLEEIIRKKAERSPDLKNKEKDLEDVLMLALEMNARGFKIENISLEKSQAKTFILNPESNSLIPPFMTLEGLGVTAAESIVKARSEKPFVSKIDLMNRTSLNQTLLKEFEKRGLLKELDEDDQLTLKLF